MRHVCHEPSLYCRKAMLTAEEVPRLFVAVAATPAIAETSPSTLKLIVAVNWLPKLLDWPLEYQDKNGLETSAVTRVVSSPSPGTGAN